MFASMLTPSDMPSPYKLYPHSHYEWPHWVTQENSKFHMFNTFTPAQWYPWKPLVDLVTSCSLKQAPVLRPRWRTRLLHPHFPYYYSDTTASKLADHCSQSVGIRMTEDGYITADWHMDLPPMRRVLLDPYSGWGLLLYTRGDFWLYTCVLYSTP